MKKTPLYDTHLAFHAKMVSFHDYVMPLHYDTIINEHQGVRKKAGLFDISHMGRFEIRGDTAFPFIQSVITNDAGKLEDMQVQYTPVCNERGGILDDVLVYKRQRDHFLLIVNCGNKEKDWLWFQRQAASYQQLEIKDLTDTVSLIALQGPLSLWMLEKTFGRKFDCLKRFYFGDFTWEGVRMIISRTGYTGEDGFEIILAAETAESVWQALLQAGCTPCGLGARDTLRVEAGYPLYGHEIDEHTSPVEAGLLWAVKLEKGDFTGREAILRVKEQGPTRRLAGLVLADRVAPRQGYTLHDADSQVGIVTSGAFSPIRGCGIGMAYLAPPYHRPSTQVEVDIRGKRHAAVVVSKKDLLLRS